MRGLGTIINALAIVIGGVLGILFKRFLKEALSGYNHQSHGLFRGVSGSGGNALQDTDG